MKESEKNDTGLRYPWLFPGAWAKYFGNSIISKIATEVFATFEVLEINHVSGHFKLQASVRIKQERPGTFKAKLKDTNDQKTQWFKIGEHAMFGKDWKLEYKDLFRCNVKGIGWRNCIVEQYTNGSNREISIIDEEYDWPWSNFMIFRTKEGIPAQVNYLDGLKRVLDNKSPSSFEDSVAQSDLPFKGVYSQMIDSNIKWGV